jgi:hypothetical protein
MHPEHALAGLGDEGLAHELRPAYDEDQVRFERAQPGERLVGVDVTCLVQLRSEP